MGQKYTISIERYRHFFIILLIVIFVSFFIILVALLNIFSKKLFESDSTKLEKISLENLNNIPEVIISKHALVAASRNYRCSYYDCFNVYRCGRKGSDQISVYVYPLRKYVDEHGLSVGPQMTKEYYAILKAIVNSRYYSPNPEEACILVPSIDTLNQNRLRLKEVSQALGLLPYWYGGENHLIWNMLPGSSPDYNTVVDLALGNALIAGAGFDSWTYRVGFDVSLPVYSPYATTLDTGKSANPNRRWLVVSSQVNIHPEYSMELLGLAETRAELLVLEPCPDQSNTSLRCSAGTIYSHPHILQEGSFCLVLRGARLGQPTLLEALAAGCIPIVTADAMVMPFADIIDWKRAALFVGEADLNTVIDVAASVSEKRRDEMREQGLWLYQRYFSTMEAVTLTALDIINDRVFPHHARPHTRVSLVHEPGSTHLEMDQIRQCMDIKEPSRVKFRRAEPDPRLLAVRLGSGISSPVYGALRIGLVPPPLKNLFIPFSLGTAGQTLCTTRSAKGKRVAQSPLFLPLTAPRAPGFTAVILTYDRVESLFTLINKLVRVPSLSKVIVVWNNQRKNPPPMHLWPKVNKLVKLIHTKENKLSNRFYPYEEIETEAILTIDDDIVMLTADELEFGFERPHEQQWCATLYRSLLYTRKFSCEGIRSDGTWACWGIRDVGTITREQGSGVAGMMSES
ncbi:Exostosin-2 [Homalodisca vitripennis]|nr:Exostosin-2 [Homalodisca vitripennis]